MHGGPVPGSGGERNVEYTFDPEAESEGSGPAAAFCFVGYAEFVQMQGEGDAFGSVADLRQYQLSAGWLPERG